MTIKRSLLVLVFTLLAALCVTPQALAFPGPFVYTGGKLAEANAEIASGETTKIEVTIGAEKLIVSCKKTSTEEMKLIDILVAHGEATIPGLKLTECKGEVGGVECEVPNEIEFKNLRSQLGYVSEPSKEELVKKAITAHMADLFEDVSWNVTPKKCGAIAAVEYKLTGSFATTITAGQERTSKLAIGLEASQPNLKTVYISKLCPNTFEKVTPGLSLDKNEAGISLKDSFSLEVKVNELELLDE
jgi:hypothetical protein